MLQSAVGQQAYCTVHSTVAWLRKWEEGVAAASGTLLLGSGQSGRAQGLDERAARLEARRGRERMEAKTWREGRAGQEGGEEAIGVVRPRAVLLCVCVCIDVVCVCAGVRRSVGVLWAGW
jgi:hypothetical protein